MYFETTGSINSGMGLQVHSICMSEGVGGNAGGRVSSVTILCGSERDTEMIGLCRYTGHVCSHGHGVWS